MKLYFKQRPFRLLDSYDIYFDNGAIAYTVESEFALLHRLTIYDRDDEEIAVIQQKFRLFFPEFEVTMRNMPVGSISKDLTLFAPRFNIDFLGWEVDGDFFEWDYQIFASDGILVATVSKELFHISDQYVLDIINPIDAPYVVAFVVAMDAEKCSRPK